MDTAAEGLGPPPHARDSIAAGRALRLLLRLPSPSVVFDGEHDLTLHHSQFCFDRRAAGMPGGIVKALFENQEEMPPRLETQVHVFYRLGRSQLEVDALAG